jgi:hypothetical protein
MLTLPLHVWRYGALVLSRILEGMRKKPISSMRPLAHPWSGVSLTRDFRWRLDQSGEMLPRPLIGDCGAFVGAGLILEDSHYDDRIVWRIQLLLREEGGDLADERNKPLLNTPSHFILGGGIRPERPHGYIHHLPPLRPSASHAYAWRMHSGA